MVAKVTAGTQTVLVIIYEIAFEFPLFVRASALSYGGKIPERLRVKRESLTGVAVHIGILCLYLFSARVVVFRECLRISEERRETIVAVWPFLKGFAHVIQSSR